MSSPSNPSWQLWIDTGGTFTDCFAINPAGETSRLKVLSSSVLRGVMLKRINDYTAQVSITWPLRQDIFKNFEFRVAKKSFKAEIENVDLEKNHIQLRSRIPKGLEGCSIEITSHEEVPVLAARLMTATALDHLFPALSMRLGSTRGTNAILERTGAKTALLVTKGFKDLISIGDQQRKDLFALHVIKPTPLYDFVLEIDERIEKDGNILKRLDPRTIESIATRLQRRKIESIAIALLNSYKNPVHEKELAASLAQRGFKHISISSILSSQIKILPRAETTIANAYLDPIVDQYVSGIERGLSGAALRIMTSTGSLVKSGSFFPKDSLLSGPAGGVVGAAHQAARSGIRKIIAFDMGGTSTDVSLYNDRFDYRFESRVGDLKILSPSLTIETIAAGGGSICDFDGYRFTVGPQSAGVNPGPACYGANGPLTITDVNVLLGRVDSEYFAIPIDQKKSQVALQRLLQKVKRLTGETHSPVAVLESLIQIANEKMARAIKKISLQQGYDPREFVLLSFGGAGGQHACSLAEALGMKKVLVPYDAGLLSAYGIGHAVLERFEERLVLQPWKTFESGFSQIIQELFDAAKKKLQADHSQHDEVRLKKTLLFLRFEGQDSSLEIEYNPGDDVLLGFHYKYISVFGHWIDRPVELESIRIMAAIEAPPEVVLPSGNRSYEPHPEKVLEIVSHGKRKKGCVFKWENLKPGARIEGPALVVSGNSTTFVEDHWTWSLDDANNGRLLRKKTAGARMSYSQAAYLELFTNRFTALAQEMGALLQRVSFSVNVKERLDFSCAILDRDGYLVVNAPHIPVHLGSMGVCVREVARFIMMSEGDVVITNHPAFGGSHLPDVTLIKPVFYERKLIGYVANRAHHAEIGGKKPGSMPADATHLEEEGVIIKPMYLVKGGQEHWRDIRNLLSQARYPTRALEENLADINGALAAITLGEKGLQDLCSHYQSGKVLLQMRALRKYAASLMQEKIKSLRNSSLMATERLDDGSLLNVKISRKGLRLKVDFTGSAKIHPGNLNATKAIVQSVVLYCLRLVVDHPLPMNEGLLEPVDIVLPVGLLNPNFSSVNLPAVVGGNTEVSQRLTDTMLKAFALAACSQGTMNNFLFGNDRFGYYETICGGTGAGPDFAGTDAVHQHMTNTLITDPEIMEFRYPIRLERFEIRKGSGGKGTWNGGDGVEREIFFKDTLEINLLTQHRKEKPYGMKGGAPGKSGEQFLITKNGKKEKLKGIDSRVVHAGDSLIIKTPGGGAWGRK